MKINVDVKSIDRISLYAKFYFSKPKEFSGGMLMQIKSWGFYTLTLFALLAGKADAVIITPTDLNNLTLGAQIEGPVGPTVDTTFAVDSSGIGLADFSSSVSCPDIPGPCIPSDNQGIPGFVYTYVHAVTPGDDGNPDNLPTRPDQFLALANVNQFSLDFSATGFNGVAGFDFQQVQDAVAVPSFQPTIEQLTDGTLVWDFAGDLGWGQDETITFFWQTSQAPSGPDGVYGLNATDQERGSLALGSARGPLPQPLAGPGPTVPEPTVLSLFLIAALAIGWQTLPRFSLNLGVVMK